MTETKIYCDHCGKELNYTEDYNDITLDVKLNYIYTDLCDQCLHDLYQIVDTFCSGLKFKRSTEALNKEEEIEDFFKHYA